MPKELELRVTVIGNKVLAASINSQEVNDALHDWRRASPGSLRLRSYKLPTSVSDKCVRLVAALVRPTVLFNYLGRFTPGPSDMLIGSPDPVGPDHDGSRKRDHLIDLYASVYDDRLVVSLLYSENYHRAGTARKLLNAYLSHLSETAA